MAPSRPFARLYKPSAAATLLPPLLAVAVAAWACRGACRSLQHCQAEHCAVLSALQVGQEQPKAVGCVEKERDNAPGVATYARDRAGMCWIFPTTLVAEGFVADDSCSP